MLETERKRVERAKKKNKLTRAELKEKAKTDPEAAKQLEAMRAKEAEARQRKKEREEARMAADPEYAAMMEARKKEYIRTRTAKRKAEHEALVELAKTDEEAARKLAEKRKYQSEATVKCYQKLKADAEAGDPEAVAKYEEHLAIQRETPKPSNDTKPTLPSAEWTTTKRKQKRRISSMNELWIVRFVRKDGKPDEEYYYRSLAEAEHHKNLFLDDNSGLYERIEIINDKH